MLTGVVHKMQGETVTLAATLAIATCRLAPRWANAVEVHCPSATLENIELALSPRLLAAFHYKASADKYFDLTAAVSDRNTSTLGSLVDFLTADYLYVGAGERFQALGVDVTTANAVVGTTTAQYSTGDGTWAALTITDNTDTGASLAQDGLITWTVPSNWKQNEVNGVLAYYVRFISSVNLTALVTIAQLMPLLNKTLNSADKEIAQGNESLLIRSNNDTQPPYRIPFDPTRFGGIELKSTSITSAANVNWLLIK